MIVKSAIGNYVLMATTTFIFPSYSEILATSPAAGEYSEWNDDQKIAFCRAAAASLICKQSEEILVTEFGRLVKAFSSGEIISSDDTRRFSFLQELLTCNLSTITKWDTWRRVHSTNIQLADADIAGVINEIRLIRSRPVA